MKEAIPLPVVFTKEGKWHVAWCPVIDVATQGKTFEEAEENIKDLIHWYFEDKDTPKPTLKTIMSMSVSISTVPVKIPRGVAHSSKTSHTVCT